MCRRTALHTDGYRENDIVRVTRALADVDPYTGESVSVDAGAAGTVIVGAPGCDSFDVEFLLRRENGQARSAVLILQAADLEPYPKTATV